MTNKQNGEEGVDGHIRSLTSPVMTLGSVLFSVNAGYINAIAWIGAFKIGVSHQTGNSTGIGLALVSGDLGRFTVIVSILLCFILGAFVSGIIVGDNKLRLSNLYTVCLLVQSIAIFLAYGFLQEETYNGEICLAFACGMQNALCSAYTGPVLRTTHITESGKAEMWKLLLLLPATIGFIAGGFVGVIVFNQIQEKALLVSAASSCTAAIIGMIYLEVKGRGLRHFASKKVKVVTPPHSSLMICQNS